MSSPSYLAARYSLQPPSSWRGLSIKPRRPERSRQKLKRIGVCLKLMLIGLCLLLPNGCVTVLTSTASVIGAGASTAGAYFDYLTAEKAEGVIIVPPIQEYTPEFLGKAASESEYLKEPCRHDLVNEKCSALGQMLIDYGVLRDKIRAAADQ